MRKPAPTQQLKGELIAVFSVNDTKSAFGVGLDDIFKFRLSEKIVSELVIRRIDGGIESLINRRSSKVDVDQNRLVTFFRKIEGDIR